MPQQVYLCYQYREKPLANELAAALSVTNLPLDAYDGRLRFQVTSEEAQAPKSEIERNLISANTLLCLLGPTTATSSWVNWELTRALELGKGILLVVGEEDAAMPSALENAAVQRVAAELPTVIEALDHIVQT